MGKLEIVKKACEDKLGRDLVILSVEKSNVADYFVIVTGNTKIHTQAIADEIEEKVHKAGFTLRSREGFREGDWILMDLDDIIVHIFTEATRNNYRLERLWEEEPEEVAEHAENKE